MSTRDDLLGTYGMSSQDAPLGSLNDFRHALDAYRVEVLTDLARLFDDRGRALLDGGIMTAADVADLIRQHIAGKDTDGGIQSPADESTQPEQTAPDFFQSGRTYTIGSWTFRCDVVTTHPETGQRTALGWTKGGGSGWVTTSERDDDWDAAKRIEITEVEQPTAPTDRFPYLGGAGGAA